MALSVTTITDPDGTDWVLDGTDDAGGVSLWRAGGRKGFQGATYVHFRDESPAVNGAFYRGSRTTVRDLFVPIFIKGSDPDAVRAKRRLLAKRLAPHRGECVISTVWPDGSVRSINARYLEGLDAAEYGPGSWGVTSLKYGLRFIADDPQFYSAEIAAIYQIVVSSRLELPIPGADTLFDVVSPDLLVSDVGGPVLNTNSDFETAGPANWTGIGGALVQDLVFFHGGIAAGNITPDGVTATVSIDSDAVAVTAGSFYSAAGWLANDVGRTLHLRVKWYNAGMVLLLTDSVSVTVAAATYTYVSSNFQAPATAAFAMICPTMTGTPPASNIMYADDVELRQVGGSTLTNPGDVDAYPEWELTGPFTSVTAENLTTGKQWTISYGAAAGDKLFLITKPGETALTNSAGVNQWDKLTAGYQLWPLTDGDNEIRVSVTDATVDSLVRLSFVPLYESE